MKCILFEGHNCEQLWHSGSDSLLQKKHEDRYLKIHVRCRITIRNQGFTVQIPDFSKNVEMFEMLKMSYNFSKL